MHVNAMCVSLPTQLIMQFLEIVVAKGEIAQDQEFLHFPQCFQKLPAADASKRIGGPTFIALIRWNELNTEVADSLQQLNGFKHKD